MGCAGGRFKIDRRSPPATAPATTTPKSAVTPAAPLVATATSLLDIALFDGERLEAVQRPDRGDSLRRAESHANGSRSNCEQ
jgi:hypothetical protein